MPFKTIDQVI